MLNFSCNIVLLLLISGGSVTGNSEYEKIYRVWVHLTILLPVIRSVRASKRGVFKFEYMVRRTVLFLCYSIIRRDKWEEGVGG